jgi:hypothetical protein
MDLLVKAVGEHPGELTLHQRRFMAAHGMGLTASAKQFLKITDKTTIKVQQIDIEHKDDFRTTGRINRKPVVIALRRVAKAALPLLVLSGRAEEIGRPQIATLRSFFENYYHVKVADDAVRDWLKKS